MVLSVDESKCIGCGACAAIAPKCFKMNDNFKAEVIKGCKCDKNCKDAAANCPVEAIKC